MGRSVRGRAGASPSVVPIAGCGPVGTEVCRQGRAMPCAAFVAALCERRPKISLGIRRSQSAATAKRALFDWPSAPPNGLGVPPIRSCGLKGRDHPEPQNDRQRHRNPLALAPQRRYAPELSTDSWRELASESLFERPPSAPRLHPGGMPEISRGLREPASDTPGPSPE